jgi:hypothetical protein
MFRAKDGVKQYSSKMWGNALLVVGALAVLVAMAGWLYFLGWFGWHFVRWVFTQAAA